MLDEKALFDWLKAAPVDWTPRVDGMDAAARYDLAGALCSVAVRVARLAAYVSKRSAHHSHRVSVNHQNDVARKVRKALGYTYTEDHLTF